MYNTYLRYLFRYVIAARWLVICNETREEKGGTWLSGKKGWSRARCVWCTSTFTPWEAFHCPSRSLSLNVCCFHTVGRKRPRWARHSMLSSLLGSKSRCRGCIAEVGRVDGLARAGPQRVGGQLGRYPRRVRTVYTLWTGLPQATVVSLRQALARVVTSDVMKLDGRTMTSIGTVTPPPPPLRPPHGHQELL